MRSFLFSILVVWLILPASTTRAQSRYAANVLYSDAPRPIYIGIELGSGLTYWQHSTPLYFPTDYPYGETGDTIHTWFPGKAHPLFGFFIGATADFAISNAWGVIAKINYNERRGNWTGSALTECDMNGGVGTVTINNDLTWMLRCVSVEAELRYAFASLHDLYLGGGLAATTITSDHYDLTQTIDGPPECTFLDLGTGQGTGIRSYGIGRSMKSRLTSTFAELKALVGYPFYIGSRWRLDPQITFGYALTPIFNSAMRDEYAANGVSSAPKPMTFTGLLSLRYQIR